MTEYSVPARFRRVHADGDEEPLERALAVEAPIAVEYNGIGYAVLMATPADLHDLAAGFALAERLVDGADDIADVELARTEAGLILRTTLVPRCAARVAERVRHRVSESSCGLCGIENLEQALRPLPPVTARCDADAGAVFEALDDLDSHQPLNRRTGAAHAAALVAADGTIRMAREDVGRHNAFDKLVGAMLRGRIGWDGGFALLTSRCSFELVEKAVLAGCPLLATVSAPTSLAVERAAAAGLRLIAVARSDSFIERA